MSQIASVVASLVLLTGCMVAPPSDTMAAPVGEMGEALSSAGAEPRTADEPTGEARESLPIADKLPAGAFCNGLKDGMKLLFDARRGLGARVTIP